MGNWPAGFQLGQTGEVLGAGDLPAAGARRCLGQGSSEGAAPLEDASSRRKPRSERLCHAPSTMRWQHEPTLPQILPSSPIPLLNQCRRDRVASITQHPVSGLPAAGTGAPAAPTPAHSIDANLLPRHAWEQEHPGEHRHRSDAAHLPGTPAPPHRQLSSA